MADVSQPGVPYAKWAGPQIETKAPLIEGEFSVRGANDTELYPADQDSLHTIVKRPGKPVEGMHKPNYWQRTFYTAFLLLVIHFFTGVITDLVFVVVQERAIFNGIENAVVSGIALGVQLMLSAAVIHRVGGILALVELFMGHYSQNIPLVWQRLVFWLIVEIGVLGGEVLAALVVWAIQVDNSVTFAGMPRVTGSLWTAWGLESIGAAVIYWAYFRLFYDPDAASDPNHTNAFFTIALAKTAVTYIAQPYTGGCFSVERWFATALISGGWESSWWVYAVGPATATLVIYAAWYWGFRTTKDGSVKIE